jgi:hypothetical protein
VALGGRPIGAACIEQPLIMGGVCFSACSGCAGLLGALGFGAEARALAQLFAKAPTSADAGNRGESCSPLFFRKSTSTFMRSSDRTRACSTRSMQSRVEWALTVIGAVGLLAFCGYIFRPTPSAATDEAERTPAQVVRRALAGTRLDDIRDKVAADAVDQYEIAKRQGDKLQTCVQAGFVSAAFLQAKNEPQYNAWKATEAADCAAAGMPKAR